MFVVFNRWEYTITCTRVHSSGTKAAELLGGAMAGPPQDVGGPAMFVSELNQLSGVVIANRSAGDSFSGLSPDSDKWWAEVNGKFRNVNCQSIVYSPTYFDLVATRAKLHDTLMSVRRSMKNAADSNVQFGGTGSSSLIPSNINSTIKHREQRVCAAKTCPAAGISACAGCREVYYCCQVHQRQHWKEHKAQCKQAQRRAAPVIQTTKAEPGELIVGGRALTELTPAELKVELTQRGLGVTGKKKNLLRRLAEAMQAVQAPPAESVRHEDEVD